MPNNNGYKKLFVSLLWKTWSQVTHCGLHIEQKSQIRKSHKWSVNDHTWGFKPYWFAFVRNEQRWKCKLSQQRKLEINLCT